MIIIILWPGGLKVTCGHHSDRVNKKGDTIAVWSRENLLEFQQVIIELPRALQAVRELVNRPKIIFRRLRII